jgi:hypothetical protein
VTRVIAYCHQPSAMQDAARDFGHAPHPMNILLTKPHKKYYLYNSLKYVDIIDLNRN